MKTESCTLETSGTLRRDVHAAHATHLKALDSDFDLHFCENFVFYALSKQNL